MRIRRLCLLAAGVLLPAGDIAAQEVPRDELLRRAALAQRRARSLERRADAVAAPAERARLREAAVAARVAAAEADIAVLGARSAAVARRLAAHRRALADREAPTARLLAALLSIARRPAATAMAQPGSVADLVHVRAVLDAVWPALRARSSALRARVAGDRTRRAVAAGAERRLRAGRARLMEAREQLAALSDGDDDRVLAMEEAVRETAARLATIGGEQAVLNDLLALDVPPARAAPSPVSSPVPPVYRLPVRGRLLTGMGELSANGVRARGLTIGAPAAATIVAPAAGRIGYAGPFRSFGRIIIIDHGTGWTTLISGLGSLAVQRGVDVAAGAPLGRAPAVEGARITVELRRRGRPVDVAQLAG